MFDADKDALIAAVDLVRRAGAKNCEIGFLDEDAPGTWYAHAAYQGKRVIVENQAGPVEAAETLALRLFRGATCRRCGDLIQLEEHQPGCLWVREGQKWVPGCGKEINHDIPAIT